MDVFVGALLPIAVVVIMFSLGLGLTLADFRRILHRPRAFLIGALNQVILLPVIAFLIILVFGFAAETAVGFMILSACPGGAVSNIITKIADWDVALSVTLTAAFSLTCVVFDIRKKHRKRQIIEDRLTSMRNGPFYEDGIAQQKGNADGATTSIPLLSSSLRHPRSGPLTLAGAWCHLTDAEVKAKAQEDFSRLKDMQRYADLDLIKDTGMLMSKKKLNLNPRHLPYDHNRVILQDLNASSGLDYVNASWISLDEEGWRLIAAQHPNAKSACLFWQMVHENNVRHVVSVEEPGMTT